MAEIDVTRIAGNIGAMNSLNALSNINRQLSVHQTRLSTGKRINSAADDPAGLTIATKMNARSEGLKVALSNIGDAKNLLAVAESGLGRINDIIVQMRNKSEAAASDTLGSEERRAIVTQLKAYAAQIDDIASQTEWNGNKLIEGKYFSSGLSFQTGAGQSDYTQVSELDNVSATGAANGRDSLKLATKAATASVAIVGADGNDLFTGGSDPAQGAVANTNLSSLSSGQYTVRLTMTATNAGTVSLLDAGGNAMLISQSPADGTGAVGKSVSLAGMGATASVNFGNGLSVTINKKADASTTDSQVSWTASGDYTLKANGDTGNDLATGTATDFRAYMSYLDTKLQSVSSQLSKIGAVTGRLTFKEEQVSASQINTEAAYNRVMNANMAEEQVNASKFQILQQTATAMLAQANAAPQFLLSLFR